jgi:hypothetical protein
VDLVVSTMTESTTYCVDVTGVEDLSTNVTDEANDTATFLVDTSPPTGTITIDSGATYTSSTSVTLDLTCDDGTGSGCDQMRISNDGTFDSEPWEAFAASKPWTITAGDALKTVYIKFRDVAGNESGAFTDTITLETVLPTGTVTIDAGATYTTSTSVTLDLTCDDGVGSGCDQMRISNDGTFDSEPWEAFAVSKAWTLTAGDATKTVYVIFRDVAGNESSPVDTDDIILDTTDPVVASASASTDDTHVDVVFTEDNGLDPGTAGDFNNYAIWDGGACGAGSQLAVTAAVQVGNTVTLTTATQIAEQAYRVCASNINDVPGNTLGLGFADFTGFILTDVSAPNAATINVTTSYTRGFMLSWTVPYDDEATSSGTASTYDVRYTDAVEYPGTIDSTWFGTTNWDDGTTIYQAAKEPTPTPGTGGTGTEYFSIACAWDGAVNANCEPTGPNSFGKDKLWPNTLYYISMKSEDEWTPVNISALSNVTDPFDTVAPPSHTAMKYGYNMISIPYDIKTATSTFSANFIDDVSPGGITAPVIYKWQPAGMDLAGTRFNGSWVRLTVADLMSTELNGTGFYIYSWGYNNVLDVDTATVQEYGDLIPDENWVEIDLEQGRNLVGNPYLKNVDFDNIKICQNATGFVKNTDITGNPCLGTTAVSYQNAVLNGWVSGDIVNHVTNDTSADIETCNGLGCTGTAYLRPWWGQWIYVVEDPILNNYKMAIPRPQ